MEKLQIVTDSTCDLPKEITEKYGIRVVPMEVMFGNTPYRDGIDLTQEQYLTKIREGNTPFPTTSAPVLGTFMETYASFPENNILSIHLGRNYSATHDNALMAARELNPDRITVYNSKTTSLGLGFAVVNAALWSQESLSVRDIVMRLDDQIRRTKVFASINDLEYARRGGRLKGIRALASLLPLKPVLEIDNDEITTTGTLIHKRSESLNALFTKANDLSPFEMVGVAHAEAEEEALKLSRRIGKFHQDAIWFLKFGAALLAHAGPKAVELAFVTLK